MGTIYSHLRGKREFRILLVGMEHSGKTTLTLRLSTGEFVEHVPPVRIYRPQDIIQRNNTTYAIWDIAGNLKFRPLWNHYFNNSQALIYVVDSTDFDKFDVASDIFKSLLKEQELRNTPFVILANKQDHQNAMSVAEVSSKLCLNEMDDRRWTILGTSAVTGEGLKECLDWLDRTLRNQ